MRVLAAFRYALAGIIYCVRRERHVKLHLAAAFAAIGLAWWLELSSIEVVVLLMTIAGVITAEIFNTALEAIVDKVSPEYHPLAKVAKDAAAGAVLVQAVAALGVGYVLFWDKLLK
ncbi:diacylglycerol kinase family protein [Sporomusa malonica]|uniref:Diacylglycerol kinase (ATP) n=1 Tax=Sporomusa malonica TaxID=112901 RepID=A0A1W2D8V6_9FIRM|nr:diacylglycerol kinase family protein [Sporomusa malonica]SMC93967.1 diacylglycerol kinase (ATP) [Sporomusa malonica]